MNTTNDLRSSYKGVTKTIDLLTYLDLGGISSYMMIYAKFFA